MNYEFKITSDQKKIKELRDNFLFFTVYSNFNQKTSNLQVNLGELDKYIVQTNIAKNNRNFIIVNPINEGQKTLDKFYLPFSVIIDIDGHNKTNKDKLIKDMQANDYKEALSIAYNRLKTSNLCYYLDYSQGGEGLHALVNVFSNYWQCNSALFEPSEQNSEIAKALHHHNFFTVIEYLKTIGFNFYHNANIDYIDIKAKNLNLGLYSSNGEYLFINHNASILLTKFEPSDNGHKNKNNNSIGINTIDEEQLTNLNNNYVNRLRLYINSIANNRQKKQQLIKQLSKHLSHYNEAILFSLKHLSKDNLEYFYNTIYKHTYKGQSVNISTFEAFYKYLHRITKSEKFAGLLANLLDNVELFSRNSVNSDFFENKYNQILEYNGYISEKSNELNSIIDNNSKVVIKAPAGGGKSTYIFEYISQNIHKYKKVVLCSPKNSLLFQQLTILKAKYPKLNIVENFGNKRAKQLDKYDSYLVLSSTPKINLIDANLIIVDEIHNLTNYSNTIVSNINNNAKLVLISATPEPYLIFETGFYYVNLVKKDIEKKRLNLIISNDYKKTVGDLINTNNTFIFYNNIDGSKQLASELEQKNSVKFHFLNRENAKETENRSVIDSQLLQHSHYIATSFISDGINFNNEGKIRLIIIDNGLSIFEIYQLTERFRLAEIEIYLIAKKRLNRDIDYNFNVELFRNTGLYCNELGELEQFCNGLNVNKFKNNLTQLSKDSHIMKDINNNYVVNRDSLKLKYLNQCYYEPYSLLYSIYYESLTYYFNVKRQYNYVENKQKNDKNIDDLGLFFAKNSYEIVELYRLNSGFAYIDNSNLAKNDINTVQNNIVYFKKCCKRAIEIELRGANYLEYVSIIIGKKQTYTRLINSLSLEAIGKAKSAELLDGLATFTHDKQNELFNIIQTSGIIKQHNQYNYFTIADLIAYFEQNRALYEVFKKYNSSYLFNLNNDSLGRFVNSIERYFEKRILWVDKKSTKVIVIK